MAETPLRRAAQAAHDALSHANVLAYLDMPEDTANLVARAVLQAIREPSEAMTRKGGGQGPWDSYAAPDDADNARDVWLAMIDAALEEG